MTKPTIDEMKLWTLKVCEPLMRSDIIMLEAIHDYILSTRANTLPLDELPEDWQVIAMFQCNAGIEGGGWCCEIAEAGCLLPIIKAYAKTPAEAMRAAIAQAKEIEK